MSTVVITGAARGQGAAHAAALAAAGYALVLTDRMDDAGEEVASTLRSSGADARYYSLDVADEGGWGTLATTLERSGAHLVGLVNNAGILRYGTIAETDAATWLLHDRVNALGAFLGIRALAPLMTGGEGSIVNISSTAALVGSAGYAAYSASKAALLALTRVAAVEYAPAVRVNAICPGGVSTPMNDDEPIGGTSSTAPLARRARPEEISPLVTYLISPASAFVTGSVLTIDGGLTAV
ncbi:MAG: SDR family oxidoreductase [Microbacterium sp.]|uniref:SDR family NAD(P)-dependent oxidoreductase n=1 Tax=Microbacterium sp. TaxID=51671 RepID=UPI001AD41916|nr:SDR family oxidoreductase [Microbacterium sp.]MBN9176638.1 SDR family oxidoreductase [Microbacterium sp.]